MHAPRGPRLDNRSYYDEFAGWYERERGRGYHQMLDDLEVALVERYGRGGDVLEAGCGTGLILERIARFARSARGIDLSGGMLARAHARGLEVAQASVTALPYQDASFDVVCSFKVLAHVPPIREAVAELVRVTAPGGTLLLEFYNPQSLRFWAKRLTRPGRIAAELDESHVFTRFDSADSIRGYLPAGVALVGFRGIRVVSPGAFVYRLPIVGSAFAQAERWASHSPLSRFGGFLVAVLRKES